MAAEPVYVPRSSETLYHIAREVVQLLKQSGETLAVFESLTGGEVMATLTSVEGCSAVFRAAGLYLMHSDVASQMATGARDVMTQQGMAQTSWGIGTTGVAGPAPQDEKPVGMVFIGVASAKGGKGFGPFLFPGSRERVRDATIIEALFLLRQELISAREQA
ncbi:hypothetical protein LOZ65_000341 [Ophidiomyces ophidiicola]|nr:hypothetical protein LOZ65_000341 [Ophidiomyces ophidiicola]